MAPTKHHLTVFLLGFVPSNLPTRPLICLCRLSDFNHVNVSMFHRSLIGVTGLLRAGSTLLLTTIYQLGHWAYLRSSQTSIRMKKPSTL
ncbi:MAG: hypothetical protein VKJ64_14180, partial [Leptolyngbyaceae bacterium]|nr:hypothetical protein [Leptolyngbyaceae bacterium]